MIFRRNGVIGNVLLDECDQMPTEWYYTSEGQRQGRVAAVTPDTIKVPAALRPHLEALQVRFQDLIGECEIKESVGTDYAFRIFVDESVWSQVFVRLNDDLDCDNFTSEVARFHERGQLRAFSAQGVVGDVRASEVRYNPKG